MVSAFWQPLLALPTSLPVALSGIFHPSAAADADADGDAEKSCRQQK